jgi:uncharacterized protein YacL
MNPLSHIYTYLYSSKIKEGYPPSTDPSSGNIVVVACLTMLFLSIGLLVFLILPELFNFSSKSITSGKTIGQLLGVFMIVILYPTVSYTVGSRSNYQTIISRFNDLPIAEQEAEVKKGKVVIILTLSSIAIPMFLGFFMA